jgi:hypothetical protein
MYLHEASFLLEVALTMVSVGNWAEGLVIFKVFSGTPQLGATPREGIVASSSQEPRN